MFKLPDLPYGYDALAPFMSADTLHFHHDKHHGAYVKKTNELVEKAGLSGRTLEEVIAAAADRGDKPLFNNAAQAWNHAFFWRSMNPERTPPSDALTSAIMAAFGGEAQITEAFVKKGVDQFGSGWVWLAAEGRALKILSTHDADDMLSHRGLTPLIVCDVWEHAYYLDYKNDREGFLKRWFAELANWDFANQQFATAKSSAKGFVYPTG